jgi:hypothetical protein
MDDIVTERSGSVLMLCARVRNVMFFATLLHYVAQEMPCDRGNARGAELGG